ncbi:MAG: BamA/TamA family outer membrane protein [candidate division KSB1 bacterium]|jgi:outer membrane protein insertion porin family|nr:BamA/TamA family outer membrane protein [candidate division KSB1 bacterium]
MKPLCPHVTILLILFVRAVSAGDDSTSVAMSHFDKISIVINEPHRFNVNEVESLLDLRGGADPDALISANIERILDYFEERAYPFARIEIDSLVLGRKDSLIACITIDPGPATRIDRIRIEGNATTRADVILREIRIKPGDKYAQSRIDKIPARLLKLGFFKDVEEPGILINEKGETELIIRLTEGSMNDVDGVIGYNPGTNDRKGYFTGLIDVSLANFLGTGRKIDTYWEKKDQETQQLRFRYLEPWILNVPFHAGASFEQLIQDTSYIQRNWKFDMSLPIADNLTLFADVGNEKVTPDSLGSILFNIPKSSSWLLNMGLRYDTRTNLINPDRGIFYSTTFEFGRKKTDASTQADVSNDASFNRQRITLDVALLIPFLKWQVFSVEMHGRQVSAGEGRIDISDMYRFGGSKSLRGFREDEFSGSQIAWTNIEYRYLLSPLSRAFIFLDSGYYSRKQLSNEKKEEYKFGYGFGIRLDTRLGIIGVDYGLAKGRSLTNGLVHVRLVNKF